MGIVQVELPDALQALVDRQISEGRIADAQSFLTEAAQRYAEDLEWEEQSIEEVARQGMADIEAGRFRTIASAEDAEAWYEERAAKLRDPVGAEPS